ncbi:MAG: hypothetical protein CMJ57_09250 [Planctomycetaceae bacterium]|nr:hypothetical protein [Planctomycetaceae bacterium]
MKNRHDPPAPAPAPAPALSPAPGGGLRRLDSAVTLQPRADERVAASSGSEAEEGEHARFELRRLAEDWLDALREFSRLTPEDDSHRDLLVGWASGMSRSAIEDDIANLALTRPKNSWKTATEYLRKRARDAPPEREEGLPKWWGFGDDVTKAYGFHTIDEAEAFERAGYRVRGPGFPEKELGAVVTDDSGRRWEVPGEGEPIELEQPSEYARRSGSGSLLELFKTAGAVALATVAGVAAAVTTNGNEWSGP